ncbi:MAG: DEAD/DEAH box helicase family protein [Thermoproteaceae archaeon]|nr:DEAD/DEAH box helicase family protein [Thermoproteaceae archaeon]
MEGKIKEEIKSALRAGSNALLKAPTGWGKTRLLLEVAVELAREGTRVAFLAPTLTLLVRKWPELLSLGPPPAILTAGAQQHCVYRWRYPQRFCARCRLRRDAEAQLPEHVTYADIAELTPEDVCSYYVQESAMQRYSIVLAHYGRAQKVARLADYLLVDEAHEYFLPAITSWRLQEIAEMLGVETGELSDVVAIKELVEEKTNSPDVPPNVEDALYALWLDLRKTCWVEEGALHCMDLRALPSGRPVLAATATPPPGWPPEGQGWRVVDVRPDVRPPAYVEEELAFRYPDYTDCPRGVKREEVRGTVYGLFLCPSIYGYTLTIIKRLREHHGAQRVAVFATSSPRRLLQPLSEEVEGVTIFDAWGRMRVGVDLPEYDAAVVLWPSLHVTARRRLRAEGRDPALVELLQGVQLAGRVLRPRQGETYAEALRRRVVVFADARFRRFAEYLAQHFEIRPASRLLQ